MTAPFAQQALDGVLNAVTWTSIAPPMGADHVVVSNLMGVATVRVRTASGDATTEIQIPAGSERALVVTPPRLNSKPGALQVNFRFLSGVVAFYMKADSGTGTGAALVWT